MRVIELANHSRLLTLSVCRSDIHPSLAHPIGTLKDILALTLKASEQRFDGILLALDRAKRIIDASLRLLGSRDLLMQCCNLAL